MNTFPMLALLAAALLAGGCNQSETSQPPPPPAKPAEPMTQPASPAPSVASPSPSVASLPPGHPPLDSDKSSLPAGHPPLDMSKQALPPGTGADVTNPQWVAPKDWHAGPPSSVRRASFAVNGASGQVADIAVTAFPGNVGGMEANINRWRGQIGLAPTGGVETVKLDINGDSATLVDFTNDATGKRMMVVTIPHAGNSWFFKMNGDAPLVEAQKEAFLGFVKSVKF